MNIREMRSTDLWILRQIHEEYYKHEFSFPDFQNKFMCAFVITDDEPM